MPTFFERVRAWFVRHWKWLVGGVGVLVVVVAAGFVFAPVPSAQGSLKGRTVEIYRNAEFRVVFSQPMRHGSVEQAFQISPAVQGSFYWKGNTVAYRPASVLEKGMTYEVTIGEGAMSLFGKALPDIFRQTFNVLDYPEVSAVLPSNDTEIRQAQTLTVLFDHPIRALTNDLAVPNLLQIQPPVKGTYHWLGTTGFEFVPQDGWTAATDFTVTVPKGTKMADGGSTIADYTWSFHTPNVWVGSNSKTSGLNPADPIRLEFNYPVTPQALRDALSVKEVKGSKNEDPTIVDHNELTTVLDKNDLIVTVEKDHPSVLLVRHKNKWQLGARYEFSLPAGWTAGLGSRGLLTAWSLSTAMDQSGFRFSASCPDQDQEKDVSETVVIKFNNPIDEKLAEKAIRISPALEDFAVVTNQWSNDRRCRDDDWSGRTVGVDGTWQPSTAYTLTVETSARDIYGQPLEKGQSIKFRTSAYSPRASLATYADYGLLAAHLPRVYQLRTMNVSKPIRAKVCSGSLAEMLGDQAFGCAIQGEKVYDPNTTLNQHKILDLDLDTIAGQALPVGFYELTLPIEEMTKQGTYQRTLSLMDVALSVKRDVEGKVLVWATDMKTGEVVPGLDVTLYVRGTNAYSVFDTTPIAQAKTDAQGVAVLKIATAHAADRFAVYAVNAQHAGFIQSDWNDGISVWNYGLESSYGSGPKHIGYVYTDRRIYRPDQKVYFKGVVRYDNDAQLTVPSAREVNVSILDGSGKEVSQQKITVSAFGTFHGAVQLESVMALGSYSITASSPEMEAKGGGSIVGYFDVREYRRPDFKVSVTQPEGVLTSGQTIQIPITGAYYQGTPLAGGKVSYEVTRRQLYYQPMYGEWYSYTNEDNFDCYWYCRSESNLQNVVSGSADLDKDGKFVLSIPANLTDYKGSATYAVTVTVTDLNQRTVSSNLDISVHQADLYVGVRSDYSKGWDAPEPEFDVKSLDPAGQVRSNVSATVKLYRRVWNSVQKKNTDGSTFYDYEKQDTLIEQKNVTTDGRGDAHVVFDAPKEDGMFVAVVEARDGQGRATTASTNRYIYRGGFGSFQVSDDHQMKIVQTKADYAVGETASLAVQTPYDQTKALVTIERDKIREYRVIDLGKTKRTIEIPITDEAVPNVYVSVLAVKGGGVSGVPEFRLGYANLQVETKKKLLNLEVKPDKEVYKPGEQATLRVTAKKADGSPVSAEVSVAVVDERVVDLLGSIDKNILGRFWFPRTIGVTTAQSLTRLVKKVFFSTEGGAGGEKGGGGSPAVRGNLLDTAYWKANVITAADGTATVSFKLPDNLTSWQVLAIGTTKDTIVGSAETHFVTRQEIMVEPALPRILRNNDKAVLGATIHNTTADAVTLDLSFEATGLTVVGLGTARTLTLPANTRKVVQWEVRVPLNISQTKVTIRAVKNGTGLGDAIEMTIPVLPYSVAEVTSASNFFDRTATERIEIPTDILKSAGDVTVSVSPNIGNSLDRGVDYLVRYPYGCSEQKTSALFANLVMNQLVRLKVTKSTPEKLAEAETNIKEAIKGMVSMQRADGGWGYWNDSERSYAYLTSYVFWGLIQAQQAGFSIDQTVLDNADRYLRDVLSKSAGMTSAQQESDWYTYISDTEKAQVLAMLATRNASGLSGYAATLYERRASLPIFGKVFLAMAFEDIAGGANSKQAATIMAELKNKLVYLNPTMAYMQEHGDYGYFLSTDTRSTALYLMALIQIQPKSDDIERLVRYLMQQKTDGYWYTTHETAMTLLSLVEYVRLHPVDNMAQQVTVYLNNATAGQLMFAQGDVSAMQSMTLKLPDLLAKGNEHEIGLEKASDRRYVYDIDLKVYKEIENIQPFENGFTVLSDYYALSDTKHEKPLTRVKQGDTVRVRMKLLVPKRRQYVAWENHLPAGLEAIDFQLKTSPQNIAGQEQQCVPGWGGESYCMSNWEYGWWWENVWKHIELRDDRVFLFADSLEPGVYEYEFMAQAITSGEFRVPPARAYEFYNPKANAHNEGKLLKVDQP